MKRVGFAACAFAWLSAAAAQILFEDVSGKTGLADTLKDWSVSHAAAWGDANGDGRPDLFVGAFADRPVYRAANAPIPNRLYLNNGGRFVLSEERDIRLDGKHARTTMALLADLDNDGDLDLVVGNHASGIDQCQSVLFENAGGGRFRDATPPGAPWPRPLGVRNISAFDIDGDGLLDLVFTDGNYRNWRDGGGRLIALRHKGGWTFEDVSEKHAFPARGAVGMGLAVGDVNADGVFDVFVADCNRLFVSGPERQYRECQAVGFPKPTGGSEQHTCGAAFGDLNGDGLLDLVTTVHGEPADIDVDLCQGIRDGMPEFTRVTDRAGLGAAFAVFGPAGRKIKGAQFALQDADNDGRVDIMLAMTYKDEVGQLQPVVLRNLGNKNGIPTFTPVPMDRLVDYYAPGPVADYDRDGRLDMFLPSWLPETPSILFHNVTPGGHWLTVRVKGKAAPFNTMGIGATVRAYAAGHAGDPRHLLARRDISIGNGYSSGEEALAHLGLGTATTCDVAVAWNEKVVTEKNVAANQTITILFPPAW